MLKKFKILISLLVFFTLGLFFQSTSAKYVIESTQVVAKISIARYKPDIELIDISSSNVAYPTYANHTHVITGHLKIKKKNLEQNNLSADTLKVAVGDVNQLIPVVFHSFSLHSETASEKIYEFSFSNTTSNGKLSLLVPEGVLKTKAGLTNDKKTFSTNLIIDNLPPHCVFLETTSQNR